MAGTAARQHTGFLLTIVLLSTALAGCTERSMSDLEAYAASVLARKGTGVDPLPPVKLPESYAYRCAAEGCVNPFEPFYQEQAARPDDTQQQTLGSGIRPDFDRNKEELELSPLDSLRMMGTLESDNEMWGIVRSPDGVIHRVQVGNYMGKNHGKIIGIMEERIDLTEIIPDGQGGWMERDASLALIE